MLAKAYTKYLRLSPRKMGLVVDLIKGKNLEQAMGILENVNKGARFPLMKTINSAFANLNHQRTDKMLMKDVVISSLRAEGGPILHRYRAATMGRATPVKHRTSHIYVELDTVGGSSNEPVVQKKEVETVVKKKEAAPKKSAAVKAKTASKAVKPKTAKSGSK